MHTVAERRRPSIPADGRPAFQQLWGFNTLTYYSAALFKAVRFDQPTAVASSSRAHVTESRSCSQMDRPYRALEAHELIQPVKRWQGWCWRIIPFSHEQDPRLAHRRHRVQDNMVRRRPGHDDHLRRCRCVRDLAGQCAFGCEAHHLGSRQDKLDSREGI